MISPSENANCLYVAVYMSEWKIDRFNRNTHKNIDFGLMSALTGKGSEPIETLNERQALLLADQEDFEQTYLI